MKPIVAVLAMLIGVNAYSATAWEHYSSGDGTAFEERWVVTTAIKSMSSDETLASDSYLGARLYGDGGLFVWVSHAASELCKFSDWKLAVDKTVIPIKPELREDTKATGLFPVDDAESIKLLKLFREGEKIAVRFHANCDNMFYLNFIGTATMTYSLDGSSAALEFLAGDAPEITEAERKMLDEIVRQLVENERPQRQLAAEEIHPPAEASGALALYVAQISQRIERNWSAPASAGAELKCSVRVRQVPGGEVIGVTILNCNGDDAVKRSVEAAIYKSSPLPEPSDPNLFDRNILLNLSIRQ